MSAADLDTATRSRLEELFLRKLPAKMVDLVLLADELLAIAHDAGGLECKLTPERYFRFRIPGHSFFDIPLERGLGRLRTICARLVTLSIESGQDVNLYGGEGLIRRTLTSGTNGQATTSVVTNFRLVFHNTMGQQDFALTAQ